jgi:hypothetical protein
MTQRTIRFAVAFLLLATALAPALMAASDAVTVKGELVDMACYIGHGASGPEHAKCAAKCALMGQPVGLLATDGKVYLLVADHADGSGYEKARKLAGEKVEIKGEVNSKDGVNALTVNEVKKS